MSLLIPPATGAPRTYARGGVDQAADSHAWLSSLRGAPAVRDAAIADLHALLLRGAHHELRRRRSSLALLSADDLHDLATQAADDALVAILAKLDTFRGASRFTTWAYKFVLLEAGVKARRRAWHDREVELDDRDWGAFEHGGAPIQDGIERDELLAAI